jgi:diguanylate cyclase (GGDEF)-like protein/PAS domain S-box-containing protein
VAVSRAHSTAIRNDPLLLVLVAVTCVSAVWVMVGSSPATVSWLWQTLLDVLYIWLSWQLSRSSETSRLGRRFWRAAAAGGLIFTVGSVLQTLDALSGTRVTAASSTVPGLLMAIGTGAVVLWLLIHPEDVTGRERLRLWLDSAIVMCAAAALTWSITLSAGPTPGTPFHVTMTVIGAGIMLVSAFAMVRMQLSGSAPYSLASGLALGAATGLFGLGAALSPYIAQAHDARAILVARLMPDLLFAAAPRIEQLRMRKAQPAPSPGGRTIPSQLPAVAVAATQALLVLQLWQEGLGLRTWGTVIGIGLMTALVMFRQHVAMADNAELTQRLGRQERRFRSFVQYASDITMLINAGGVVVYVSPALASVLGQAPEQALGRSAIEVLRPYDGSTFERSLAQLVHDRAGTATTQLRVRHTDGPLRWLEVVATNRLDDASVSGVIMNIRDVTEAKLLHDQLRHEASHDWLTGLPNKALLNERAKRLVEAPGSPLASQAMLLIDLDNFKDINDLFGHPIGDQLLIKIAERLRGCVRPTDTVARMGGDEFAVLMPETRKDGATITAQRIREEISKPALIGVHTLEVSASIGIAVSPSEPFDTLLRNADAAMYEAKRAQGERRARTSTHAT